MASGHESVRSTLNDLIQTCKASQEGFQTAATKLRDEEVRGLFLKYSQRHAGFAGQLQAEVDALRSEPPTSDSIEVAIHRGWIALKSALAVDNDLVVLEEVERGEDKTMKNYHDALGRGLPSSLRVIVERQAHEVRDIHESVRSLRDSHWKREVPMAGLM